MVTINDNCVNLIKSFEGLSLKPYHGEADRPDVFTIGYGSIKYPPYYLRGKPVSLTDPTITQEQASDFLKYEITQKSIAIDPLLRDDLTPNQFAALLSFAYNLGEGALKMSTLRAKVNNDPKDPSIKDEFVKWVYSNGQKQLGLIRRRLQEWQLYNTP